MAQAFAAKAKSAADPNVMNHLPNGANTMHPKSIEAKPGRMSNAAGSATDQRRSQRRTRSHHVTEADNPNTPAHA